MFREHRITRCRQKEVCFKATSHSPKQWGRKRWLLDSQRSESLPCPPLHTRYGTQERVDHRELGSSSSSWRRTMHLPAGLQQPPADLMGSCWLGLSPSHGCQTLPVRSVALFLIETAKHLETVLPRHEGPMTALKKYGQMPPHFYILKHCSGA